MNPQNVSPLFSTIPKEIRDLIFEYALRAYPDPRRPYESTAQYARPGSTGHPRIAAELLSTCKAIYTECYQLPVTLNPVILIYDNVSNMRGHTRDHLLDLHDLAPWQWAAIHSVEIALQQGHLETTKKLTLVATTLCARSRSTGARITPAFSSIAPLAWNTGIEPADLPSSTSSLRQSALLSDPTLLRPIDTLTLHIPRNSWWNWTHSPFDSTSAGIGQLNLDPSQSWGAEIVEFPDLVSLILVLETFAAKRAQLDAVVESAKLWTFPLGDRAELGFANVEEANWRGVEEGYGYEKSIPWLRSRGGVTPNPRAVLVAGEEGMSRVEGGVGEVLQGDVPDARRFEVRVVKFGRRRRRVGD